MPVAAPARSCGCRRGRCPPSLLLLLLSRLPLDARQAVTTRPSASRESASLGGSRLPGRSFAHVCIHVDASTTTLAAIHRRAARRRPRLAAPNILHRTLLNLNIAIVSRAQAPARLRDLPRTTHRARQCTSRLACTVQHPWRRAPPAPPASPHHGQLPRPQGASRPWSGATKRRASRAPRHWTRSHVPFGPSNFDHCRSERRMATPPAPIRR